METLVQADIFFFITSISVIVIAALLIVFLSYAIGIARDAKRIMKMVKAESDLVLHDIREARVFLRKESMKAAGFASFISRFFKAKEKPVRRKAKVSEAHEETSEESE